MCAENGLKSMARGFSHSNFNSRQADIVFFANPFQPSALKISGP